MDTQELDAIYQALREDVIDAIIYSSNMLIFYLVLLIVLLLCCVCVLSWKLLRVNKNNIAKE